MKAKVFFILVAVIILIAGTAQAATITVNPLGGADYTTIAEAVANADPYDTIQCAAGIYNAGSTLDKPLTLLGAQAGVDARTRGASGIPGAESAFSTTGRIFTLNAVDITIDGFMFENLGNRGFDSYFNTDNLTLRNNIFKATTGNWQGGNIQFGGGLTLHANNFRFEYNYVQNLGGNMIYMGHAMDNGTIRNNYINSEGFTFGPYGPALAGLSKETSSMATCRALVLTPVSDLTAIL